MSNIKEIEAVLLISIQIHKISEVLAEAFSKVKFISGEYLSSVKKGDSNQNTEKNPKAENEKSDKSNKTKEQPKAKPEKGKSELVVQK